MFRWACACGASRILRRFSRVWNAGAQRGERDFGVSLLWIFDAVRQFGSEKAQRRRRTGGPLPGPKCGGIRDWRRRAQSGPRSCSAKSMPTAADNGLRLTAHAGETAGPESIWGALNLARGAHWPRLDRVAGPGTGGGTLRAADSGGDLHDQQSANGSVFGARGASGTPLFRPGSHGHPEQRRSGHVWDHAGRGVSVGAGAFGFTDEHLRELARNSFEASFLPAEKKLEFLNLFDSVAART